MFHIAFFITEHGFGHASRASAIINRLFAYPEIKISIFSMVPKWFFEKSLSCDFQFFSVQTDVGLIQTNPFTEDLEKTLGSLERFFPISDNLLDSIGDVLKALKVDFIVSDISPLGIEAAGRTQIKSLLIENFTWDWIYEPYLSKYPEFLKYIEYFKAVYLKADFHFQTNPLCFRDFSLPLIDPIFRDKRIPKHEIKNSLGIPDFSKMILITMGGIPFTANLSKLNTQKNDFTFVIPGMNVTSITRKKNVILLPHDHEFFHPDLVHASELVIGKVGYSTIAEVYSAQIPFLYIPRKNFRESKILEEFINQEMVGSPIDLETIMDGSINSHILELINATVRPRSMTNGADEITKFIVQNIF
ncbi:MAG: hypothetical protein CVU46_08930 [Chloroflexi bacterium HGW-Chloroflexi-8]|nr:MAG: hypothetical protein CVU46_08930 [Chloroflexi bacterium HGW-Chloroflexi-8]